MIAVPKYFQIVTKTIPEKNTLFWTDAWRMFFIEILVIYGTPFPGELLAEVTESKITELFIFLYVEDNVTIFFWQGIVLPGLFS